MQKKERPKWDDIINQTIREWLLLSRDFGSVFAPARRCERCGTIIGAAFGPVCVVCRADDDVAPNLIVVAPR